MAARPWAGVMLAAALLLGAACSKAPPQEPVREGSVAPSTEASSPTSPVAEPPTGTVEILGFSGATGKGPNPPPDAAPSGSTWGSCYVDELKQLNVFLEFEGMADGKDSSYDWFLNGTEVFGEDFVWDYGAAGRTRFWIDGVGGEELEDGQWGFELAVEGQVVAAGQVLRVTQYC